MSKNNHIINSFVSGEVTPKFLGRTETQQYNAGCEKLLNTLVYPQGGAGRRPGTIKIKKIEDINGLTPTNARAFPFSGSDGSRWQIVVTTDRPDVPGGYGGGWTNGDPLNWFAVNTDTHQVEYIYPLFDSTLIYEVWADYLLFDVGQLEVNLKQIQYAQSNDIIIMTHGKMPPLLFTYDPFGTHAFTVDTYFQRSAAMADPNGWRRMPFLEPVIGKTDEGLKLVQGPTGIMNLTVEPGAGSLVTFSAEWVGKYIKFTRLGSPNRACVVLIYGYNSPTSLDAVIIGGTGPSIPSTQDYGAAGNVNFYYEMCQWDRLQGFPRTVVFFENRVVFGGSRSFPDTLWFSEVNDIYELDYRGLVSDANYASPVVNTDPFQTNLKAELLNDIRWLSSGKNITAGTNYREFVVQGPSSAKTIGPDNIQTNGETPHGSAYVQAVRIENTVVFLQRHRRAIRELVYSLDENSFKGSNLSIVAEHMANKGGESRPEVDFRYYSDGAFVMMAMQEVPYGILWCLDNNGNLAAMTREREQQVNAWHYHELGGDSPGFYGPDDVYRPFIQSISTLQKPGSSEFEVSEPDELFMVVQRAYKADAASSYFNALFLEKMAQDWEKKSIEKHWVMTAPFSGPVYGDCAHFFDSADAPSPGIIDGLEMSHGETVSVICNGHDFGDYVVNEGTIDISEKLEDLEIDDWQAIVSFNFKAHIIPVTPEVQATTGSSMANPRRIDQITIHFYRTIAAKFGRATDPEQESTPYALMEEVEFRRPGDAQNAPIRLFTGEKKLVFPTGYESRPKIEVVSDRPLPMQVTHIVARMVVYE